MFVWAVFLLLSPIIFLGVLLFGTRFMSADEIDLTKVLLIVLGPFAFDFWWITIGHFSGRYRAKRLIAERIESESDYTEEELEFLQGVDEPRHICNFIVLIVSFLGSVYCAHLFYGAGDQIFFAGVLAGILSPLIIIAAYKLFQRFN